MIRKIRNILCLSSLVCAAVSCVDDKGNYDYLPADQIMKVTIEDMEAENLFVLTDVTISPRIDGMDDENNYEFLWYIYEDTKGIGATTADTLGTNKDLTFSVSIPLNRPHLLTLRVTDKRSGVSVSAKKQITAVTAISSGWFVLKDQDGMTDMDIVLPDGEVLSDVISKAHGTKMEGEAVKVIYQEQYYYYDDQAGVIKNDKTAYHILSEGDFRTVYPAALEILKSGEGEFYAPPTAIRPTDIHKGDLMGMMVGVYLMNNGDINCYTGSTAHESKFEEARIGGGNLYPRMVAHMANQGNALVFDVLTSTFYFAPADKTRLQDVPAGTVGGLSPQNMNADMIWMGQTNDATDMVMGSKGWAIMKTRDVSPKYYLIRLWVTATVSRSPFYSVTELPATRNILTAETYGPLKGTVDAVYFGKGNVLSYYRRAGADDANTEKVAYTFPSDETITHIQHITGPKKLAVLTSDRSDWKLYLFDFDTAVNYEISTSEVATYTGEGTGRWIMYRP